jgi:hypothetical protein
VSVLNKAKQMLRKAEAKTGVRTVGSNLDLGTRGSAKLAGLEEAAAGRRTSWRNITPAELADLAEPHFSPGSVAQVSGSMTALWAVAATGMGDEDWAAIAGLPEAGLLAAAQAGLVLSRTVIVPNMGVQPLRVLAGLVDAYGLVITGKMPLAGGDRRRIEARLRFTGGRLITAGKWDGATLTVIVKAQRGASLGEGQGLAQAPRLDLDLIRKGSFGTWP